MDAPCHVARGDYALYLKQEAGFARIHSCCSGILNQLWTHTDRIAARAWWYQRYQWYRMAIDSGVKPLIRFAKNLSVHVEGLIAYTRYRLTTGILDRR